MYIYYNLNESNDKTSKEIKMPLTLILENLNPYYYGL